MVETNPGEDEAGTDTDSMEEARGRVPTAGRGDSQGRFLLGILYQILKITESSDGEEEEARALSGEPLCEQLVAVCICMPVKNSSKRRKDNAQEVLV